LLRNAQFLSLYLAHAKCFGEKIDMMSWFPSERLGFVTVLALAFMWLLLLAVWTHFAHATEHKPIRWLFNGPGLAAIAADANASRLLDNSEPFVMTGRNVGAIPPEWHAIPFASFTGFLAIQSALKVGTLAHDAEGIIYDNENWQFTPVEEQQNPAHYEKLAADLAHAHGLLFLTAPAVDLVAVLAPENRTTPYDAYLRLGIAADAARYADIVNIQAQGSERDTRAYADFVKQAAMQARQANPNVLVLAGISTNPSGQQVTANDILRAIAATRDGVDGYWFSIPSPSEYCPSCNNFRPDIAIEVLRRLGTQ
jgi:hypothetical protein